MAKKKKAKASRPRGRPVEPNSLRSTGKELRVRVQAADRARYERKARSEGKSLSEVVRELLEAWAS